MSNVPDGKKSNDYFTTLPTKPTHDATQGSLKITLPTPKK